MADREDGAQPQRGRALPARELEAAHLPRGGMGRGSLLADADNCRPAAAAGGGAGGHRGGVEHALAPRQRLRASGGGRQLHTRFLRYRTARKPLWLIFPYG